MTGPVSPVDWQTVFGNASPLTIEIGCGNGHYLVQKAGESPAENFIGIDLKINRIIRCREKQEKSGLSNLRWCIGDAQDVLEQLFTDQSVQKILMTFPDPWPKKRHFKRRLFQKPFVDLVYSRLKSEGEFIFVTDHEEYYRWCLDILEGETRFQSMNCNTEEFLISLFGKKWQSENRNFFIFGLRKR
jgi:tRNA (guanine-N7-)-methyltransferase